MSRVERRLCVRSRLLAHERARALQRRTKYAADPGDCSGLEKGLQRILLPARVPNSVDGLVAHQLEKA